MDPAKSKTRDLSGWFEVVKLLIILTAVMGTRNSFGIFFTSIENQFELSRAATSAYFSFFMILSAIFTILCGWALDRIGPKTVFMIMGAVTLVSLVLTGRTTTSWQLFITYSFLLAAGTGAGFSLVLATVSKWFVKRRGLALAIALSGEGAGTLAVAPLATFLISSYHWRTAFLLIGVIAGGLMFIVALFLKKVPTLKTAPASKISKSSAVSPPGFTLKEAAKTRSFWFLATVYMMVSFSFYLILTHIVPHAGDLGINAASAAIIVSLMGGSTIPGRLVIGSASDRYSRKKLAISCAIFEVAAMIWLTQSNSLWMFCVFAVAFGFAFGGISNLMAALIGDTFGMTNLGAISGVLVVGFSFGAAIGPAVGGIIFDATNSYYIAFLVGVGTACLAVVSLALTRREKKTV